MSRNEKRIIHPLIHPFGESNPFLYKILKKIIDYICMLGRATIGFSPTAQVNKNLVPILLRNSPSLRKDLDPLFGGFKNRIASALPTNSNSMVLSPTRLPRSSPLSYMQALPSGWDDLHLTEKWAQKTGSGTCLIYMESCSEVTRKNEMNKCKRQSALLRPSRHFSFNDFKFEYSRPLVLLKNAARSQQKKGIVR